MSGLGGLLAEALLAVFWISLPILLVAVATGIVVAIVQTLFQVQDQSLPYAIKLIAVGLAVCVTAPSMHRHLQQLLLSAARHFGPAP